MGFSLCISSCFPQDLPNPSLPNCHLNVQWILALAQICPSRCRHKALRWIQVILNDVIVLCGFTNAGADADSLTCRNYAVFFNHSSSICWQCINIYPSSFSLIVQILRCVSISNCSFSLFADFPSYPAIQLGLQFPSKLLYMRDFLFAWFWPCSNLFQCSLLH